MTAAHDLGIATFVVAPVRTASGGLHGTLCAAAARRQDVPDASVQLLTHVARLIAERLAALGPAASIPTGWKTLHPEHRRAFQHVESAARHLAELR